VVRQAHHPERLVVKANFYNQQSNGIPELIKLRAFQILAHFQFSGRWMKRQIMPQKPKGRAGCLIWSGIKTNHDNLILSDKHCPDFITQIMY
jgi:hypothetical protein